MRSLFDTDFYDFSTLWNSSVEDNDLIKAVDEVEKYSPILEDISLDDSELCTAVEKIEDRWGVITSLNLSNCRLVNYFMEKLIMSFSFSLIASESVQYFQFDSSGNMFIFQPGSGFSGPAVKVEPGFEMEIYSQDSVFCNSAVTCDTFDTSENVVPSTGISSEIIAPTPQKR